METSKKRGTAILGLLLAASLVLNCVQFLVARGSDQQRSPDPVGTYLAYDNYIVLTRDGNYCFYRQPDGVLELGVYERGEPELGQDLLLRETGGELLGQIFLRADGLYRVDMEGRAVLCPRTSDVPIYAGMEDPFLGG